MSRDLDEMRAFLCVVTEGSVKTAAHTLGIPRSTLRRRLDSLEQRLGLPLLWADATGAHPTPAGRELSEHGKKLVAAYGVLIERARRVASDNR